MLVSLGPQNGLTKLLIRLPKIIVDRSLGDIPAAVGG